MSLSTLPSRTRVLFDHIAPFVAWLLLMELLPRTAWAYAVRAAVCLGLFLWCRPWRYYPRPAPRHLPLALAVGVLVCVVWILPELPLWQSWPAVEQFYRQWGIMPPWSATAPVTESPFAPATAGWTLTMARLLGSALVIAAIEEFFWRGFLYRWLIERDFLQVDPGRYLAWAFWLTVLLFGLEHDRWLVGMAAGAAYGWLYLRTRDLWAPICAHVVTNFLLGLYVLLMGAWDFW
ncbi:CAAX prenyl protease-related protein [Geoalkalibacter halelectricus]|uniref:CAAX prenyl protease-related protein n=1 Tax=Geoalkalibacter halelectricus TaxID=2847045 RepID=A0ABY5ZM80_9BACT|nr:CAAX prenyl protease-related protein [Geoalkalibacter halelectricus]MDO3378477.1 CAAX prenyl protease-related protein [Geoalkalibacter halelectricus]UWZ80203.1 CAAX prenyl protease-related protein [Geoalkalibacter halelectricus]